MSRLGSRRPLSSRDWFGKTAAALILGFLLALGCAGLFRAIADVGHEQFSTKGQFAMWLMAPVWALTISFCFLFRSPLRAWLWLAVANVMVWAPLVLMGGLRP
jgi:hypothetical protein